VHATLEDFDDVQTRSFLQRWHSVAEEDPKERVRLQAQLERALDESRAIRDLSGNPLLLTMMAILNRNQDLPRDRVELYREASRVRSTSGMQAGPFWWTRSRGRKRRRCSESSPAPCNKAQPALQATL